MSILTAGTLPKKPTDIIPYLDYMRVWFRMPVSVTTLGYLNKQCGSFDAFDGPAPFDAAYQHRLDFRQPSKLALSWIAGQRDYLINYVEIAVDYIFQDAASRDDAFDFLDRHLVRRWHGKQQVVFYGDGSSEKTTRYDAERKSRNKIALYRQKTCRVTGQFHCLHLEWRLNGVRAVRAAGIVSAKDLVSFDHRSFWLKHLRLYSAQQERLGRFIRNHKGKGRRRRSDTIDYRLGQAILSRFDRIQELIDTYRHIRIQRVLTRIEVSELLPGETIRMGGVAA